MVRRVSGLQTSDTTTFLTIFSFCLITHRLGIALHSSDETRRENVTDSFLSFSYRVSLLFVTILKGLESEVWTGDPPSEEIIMCDKPGYLTPEIGKRGKFLPHIFSFLTCIFFIRWRIESRN
jgi:hypothetical protein